MKAFIGSTAALLCIGVALTCVQDSYGVIVIESSSVAPPEDILGEHQTLVKKWTIFSSNPLSKLELQGPGTVFIDYDASLSSLEAPPTPSPRPDLPPLPSRHELPELSHISKPTDGSTDREGSSSDLIDVTSPTAITLTAVAQVVVSGDSEHLLNIFQLVSTSLNDDEGHGLELQLNAKSGSGYFLPQIFVAQKSSLCSVKVTSSGDVVIGNNVLVNSRNDATLKLSTIGSGDLYVATMNENLLIGSLDLVATGSGDVQMQLASVNVADVLSISGIASGDIALLADKITSQRIKSTVLGSADFYVQADTVAAATFDTFIGGSGSVTYSRDGTCGNQTITIAGSGDVAAGSIECENADVNVLGSGKAVVQARHNLTATIVASGGVKYVGAEPDNVAVEGFSFRGHLDDKVKQAKTNKYHTYKAAPVPTRTPTYIGIREKKHRQHHWWNIFGGDDDDSDSSGDSSDEISIDDDSVNKDHKFKIHVEISDDDGTSSGSSDEFPPSMNPQSSDMRLAASSSSRGPSAPMVFGVFGVVVGVVAIAAVQYQKRRTHREYSRLV
uniref:Putative auto-transporter adhesin head GIN domain-containing protein n=1 Tax=Globisporangium ultimum (strain ATCC 200006 / CBS 805.95 / DAOM BR144) TaxID=431595 RepID=K3X9H9_GLOUD